MKVRNNGTVNVLLTNTPYTVLAPGLEAEVENYKDFEGILDLVVEKNAKSAK